MFRRSISKAVVVLLVLALLAAVVPGAMAKTGGKVSKFGVYSGYSEALYDNWTRSSMYVEVRDGTRLAVDIFRPVHDNDQVVEEPLPVVFSAERYVRATYSAAGMNTTLDEYPYTPMLLQHGYVVAAADVRGTGASYGVFSGGTDMTEAYDLYDLTEWFAAQPWCDGNVGMFGASYRGNNQYWAAMAAPPHLRCVFPEVSPFDGYYSGQPNGIFWDLYLKQWTGMTHALDMNDYGITVPVDGDNGTMLAEAVAEHAANVDTYEVAKHMLCRNGWNAYSGVPTFLTTGNSYLTLVQTSEIPMYHWTGWFDYFVFNQPTWFPNLEQPQKLAIGPWVHQDRYGATDLAAIEHLRWYDYWLKGIDNGIIREAPINYFTMGASEGREWRSAWDWPVPGTASTKYYLGAGSSGSVESLNDGKLSTKKPSSSTGQDIYLVDNFTLPLVDRWSSSTMESIKVDWTALDNVSLTYTTAALKADTRVTGYPVAHLWVSCNVTDADFFVYLEEIDENGVSTNVSDGLLRASHRSVNEPPWDGMGLPWHRSYSGDLEPLTPGEPVELQIALAPTSNIFDKGHRIRVTITCTDWADMFDTSREPGAEVTMYRNRTQASYISLPVGNAYGFK